MRKVVIVDYGLGNILSVKNAFSMFEKNTLVSNDYMEIKNASHLIVPGVGSFSEGIKNLKKKQLDLPIKDYFNSEKPILGICLGLQLFFSSSEEFGHHKGLDLIKGEVVRINKYKDSNEKLPIIGWKDLLIEDCKINFEKNIKTTFYFDHSYMVKPNNPEIIKGQYLFDEISVPSFIINENFIGCQFHPEKSGKIGLNLINQFLNL